MLSGYQQNAVGNEIYISYFTLTASQVAPALMSIRSVLLSAGYAVKFRNQYEGDQTLSVQITN
jgi:exo-beta-1,3-glucanase (GH17 family)